MFVCPECGASHAIAAACPADGTAMLPRGDDMLLGTTVGVYRIARLLGIGGMGRVYKGVHPQIGSRVAIKVLSRECSDRRDLVERFFSEAKAVNLIRHESIVNVLDLATLPDGRPYIVMEYLDGAPLSSILDGAVRAGQMLPLGGIARLVAEVLDALGAAHAKGIVHRDLKPDNIYVTPAGRPKILDFGIAKLQPELGGSATHTGSLMGTPHYMSPEQASGRHVDARADLYAVGVILFECATLQKPFVADSLFDLLRKHVEAPPPSPRALRPDMPEGMEHVIFAAMAKAPDQRFNSAHAMSMALQHATSQLAPEQWAPIQPGTRPASGGWNPTPPASWVRNAPSGAPTAPATPTAPTQTAGQVTRRDSKSNKGLWLGLAGLLLVGGGVTAGVMLSHGGTTTASPAPAPAPTPAPVPGPPPDPQPEPDPPPQPPDKPDKDDDGDLDADQAAQLDDMLKGLPAEAQAAWPPEVRAAIKKYGGWSKIPKAQRKKLIGQIVGMVGATEDIGDQISGALAGGGTPAPPKKPAAPTGWFTRHAVQLAGFDPKHVNVEKLIAKGYAEAHAYVPDAQVWWIDVANAYADGHADLTLTTNADVTLRFISPSHGKDDPSVPRGVPQQHHCAFYVLIEPNEAEMYETPSQNCKETLVRPPKCSVAQVWKRVLAKHPDAAGAVAQLIYRDNNGTPTWFFEIRDDSKPVDERIPDDC